LVLCRSIFSWPGVGLLLYDGLTNRDFPMVQGVVLMSGVMIVLLNFMIDVLYGYVDPRVRLSRSEHFRWPPSLTSHAPSPPYPGEPGARSASWVSSRQSRSQCW